MVFQYFLIILSYLIFSFTKVALRDTLLNKHKLILSYKESFQDYRTVQVINVVLSIRTHIERASRH